MPPRPRPPEYDAFAVAAPGLEPLVAAELEALDIRAEAVLGGVMFRANIGILARAQIGLRTASRVVVRVAEFRATAFSELEREARQLPWGRFVGERARFRLRVTCKKSKLYHSDAVAERVAAAVIRAVPGAVWEEAAGEPDDVSAASDEPSPSLAEAQLFIVRLDHDRCTISADASGELLHRRGYRLAVARAPLRETLAAAMLLGARWNPAQPLVDPLCGSGTIPIEAAMLARGIAPGLARPFAAEHWPEAHAPAWSKARERAREAIHPHATAPIIGADRDDGAITGAQANAARAGVAADIEWRVAALSALELPPGPGLIIANPPYGVRVGESGPLRDLFARFGQLIASRAAGWQVALLSADRTLDDQMRLDFEERFKTSNGGIPVRLAVATVRTRSRTRD
ncbi:MAG: class I SAM-dependent RNA methyltransferase [Gemmatimonadaceae bacterium]